MSLNPDVCFQPAGVCEWMTAWGRSVEHDCMTVDEVNILFDGVYWKLPSLPRISGMVMLLNSSSTNLFVSAFTVKTSNRGQSETLIGY